MVFNLETRKVQKTGGSSFIVSLPKEWIVSHKIQKNDALGIISQPDGKLLITPDPNSEELIKKKEFLVDDITDYDFFFRLLIGAYIMGYSRIEIKSSRKFKSFIRKCITDFTQIAIGPEIIEESSQNLVIKDLLNPQEMPFEKTIKRMYILSGTMHEDAISALKNKDITLAEQIINRDNDIDRLHWLIGRQSHIVLRDIILCQKMGITLEDANNFQNMSRFLERIGDHAVKIATNVITIIEENGVNDELLKPIIKVSEQSRDVLNFSMDAWREGNILKANENIEMIKELTKACDQVSKEIIGHKEDSENINSKTIKSSIAMSYIIESIRRTGEYAGDISEIIINNLINE
ncbi:MAG: phosphate uptake regulator PhoU [Promethearchaeota archaeon]|nr:MAG: phosphate uptake regulator PhoU [Candidatus Lokiarchaeota archaeon]